MSALIVVTHRKPDGDTRCVVNPRHVVWGQEKAPGLPLPHQRWLLRTVDGISIVVDGTDMANLLTAGRERFP